VNAFAAKAELFRSWKAWAETTGEYVGTQKALMQKLETRGCTEDRRMQRLEEQRRVTVRGLIGLRILPPELG
jgi:hypothetical protein